MATDSYLDPTHSVTHLGSEWPRRNWALKKLLTDVPKEPVSRKIASGIVHVASVLVGAILGYYAFMLMLILCYGLADWAGDKLLG